MECQNTTILKLLFKELETHKVFGNDVDYTIIHAALRLRGIKTDSESTHKMTVKNYEDFRDWMMNIRFKKSAWRGEAYALLLELMWLTGIRISAMFNLEWDNIRSEIDEVGNLGWVIRVVDKGKKLTKKPISNEMFNKLHDCFYQNGEKKIFSKLSQIGFSSLMKEFSDEFGVKITPHSIRKGGATLVFKITKDIEVVKNYCDHSNINTTIGYIENEWDRTRHGTYLLESLNTDIDFVKNLSGEQIFNMLVENDKDILMQICQRAKDNNLVMA